MADLTPLLAFRWSPRAFDPSAELTADEAASLLEAARWAPSAGTPAALAVRRSGHRQDETWKRILVSLPGATRAGPGTPPPWWSARTPAATPSGPRTTSVRRSPT